MPNASGVLLDNVAVNGSRRWPSGELCWARAPLLAIPSPIPSASAAATSDRIVVVIQVPLAAPTAGVFFELGRNRCDMKVQNDGAGQAAASLAWPLPLIQTVDKYRRS